MLKRTITGLIIAGVWVLFFVLKAVFSDLVIISTAVSKHPVDLGMLIFDILLLIMGSLGANEILRVFEKKIIRPHRIINVLYPIILFPMMSLFGIEWAVVITILAMLLVLPTPFTPTTVIIIGYSNLTSSKCNFSIKISRNTFCAFSTSLIIRALTSALNSSIISSLVITPISELISVCSNSS